MKVVKPAKPKQMKVVKPAKPKSKLTVWKAVELLILCKEAKVQTNAHNRDMAFQAVIDVLTEELERILKP